MKSSSVLGIVIAASLIPATSALSAELPPIKTGGGNAVPECATPGRMMAFIRSRNSNLDPRFEKIAVEYMREGEALGIRWDYAIAQMAIETNYLTYKAAGGKPADVRPTQNNFAGIGATGGGVHGEAFKDVQSGVRAHLQHLLLYAGDKVDDPVAERTRKVQEWGVLKSFHAKLKGPTTFKDLARKWAVSGEYGVAIQTHADKFYADFCKAADPNPELLAEVRGAQTTKTAAAETKAEKAERKVSGAELARRAIEDGKASGDEKLRGLGGAKIAKPAEPAEVADVTPEEKPKRTAMTVLNAPRAESEPNAAPEKTEKQEKAEKAQKAVKTDKPAAAATLEKPVERPAAFVTASAGGLAAKALPPAVAAGGKCRVWTASYGGQKAVIIRAQSDGAVNFTVLDVNEGAERREAEAYISAYAKGGVIDQEFGSQTQALEKAFELCPEG